MKLRLLPSSFEPDGTASRRQHFSCFVVDGKVAFDAGSLASGVTPDERTSIRDIVLTHAHLDHIAGLPLFIDDLFPVIAEPVRVHATAEVIDALETHVFNWSIYPKFSELHNEFGKVIEYRQINIGEAFEVGGLSVIGMPVNHKVPSAGFLIASGSSRIALSGDTAEMSEFWSRVNSTDDLAAILIECAFPNEFEDLSAVSHHLTPHKLENELRKLNIQDIEIYVINLKPAYRDVIIAQLRTINDDRLKVLEVGRVYEF
jgi:cAMP phosphodiesterase